jgi:hypothetical protein
VPASSPEGDGDSLGEGIELLSSPLDSAAIESTEGVVGAAAGGADLSSLAGLATGDVVSTALLVADIMNDTRLSVGNKVFFGFFLELRKKSLGDLVIFGVFDDFSDFFGGFFLIDTIWIKGRRDGLSLLIQKITKKRGWEGEGRKGKRRRRLCEKIQVTNKKKEEKE